jgi:hypothetical protein
MNQELIADIRNNLQASITALDLLSEGKEVSKELIESAKKELDDIVKILQGVNMHMQSKNTYNNDDQKDSKNKRKVCRLCGISLIEGNPKGQYGTKRGWNYISRHHLFPQRRNWFHKYFNEKDVKDLFEIHPLSTKLNFCYVCHEELFHNIIFNEQMIDSLETLFKGKSGKERVIILHKIIKLGISEYLHKQ